MFSFNLLLLELIEEEEAFEIFREQQFATIARRQKDGEHAASARGFRNNFSRLVIIHSDHQIFSAMIENSFDSL